MSPCEACKSYTRAVPAAGGLTVGLVDADRGGLVYCAEPAGDTVLFDYRDCKQYKKEVKK